MLLAAALFAAGPGVAADKAAGYGANPKDLEAHLKRLVEAYPDVVKGYDDKALILANGKRLPLSDGRTDKTFDQLLDDPDVGDMFAFAYPAGAEPSAPGRNVDPGRIRVEALFEALYGDCDKGQVSGKLRSVAWVPNHGGGALKVSTAQGADKALEAVSRELDALPERFAKYLVPSAGTYNCRPIAGTSRKSMHSYGVAIDVNTKYSAYWQWDGAKGWSNQIPREIIDIFEKHGFIWGGRWYHYDTMHFEYRPDMVGPAPK